MRARATLRLLPAAAALAGTGGRNLLCLRLQLVLERVEMRRLTGLPGERLRQEPVGEPGVPREQRPVQVRPERAPPAAAFVPALAVVPEARDDAA